MDMRETVRQMSNGSNFRFSSRPVSNGDCAIRIDPADWRTGAQTAGCARMQVDLSQHLMPYGTTAIVRPPWEHARFDSAQILLRGFGHS
jgi:hypothetical protein